MLHQASGRPESGCIPVPATPEDLPGLGAGPVARQSPRLRFPPERTARHGPSLDESGDGPLLVRCI